MPRNPPAFVEDNAADRERLKGILRLAQSSGDRYHITALRLVLQVLDDRLRAARRLRKGGRHASAS